MPSRENCGRAIVDIRGAHHITRGKYAHQECHDDTLFDVKPSVAPEALARLGGAKIWTENKAKLIERYLYYFVLVTKQPMLTGSLGRRTSSIRRTGRRGS